MEDYTIYKLRKSSHVANLASLVFCIYFTVSFIALAFYFDEFKSFRPLFIAFALLCAFVTYIISTKVLKIKWYKDKFALCTRYGEKFFSLEKADVRRFCNNAFKETYIALKNDGQTFYLEEKDFPEAFTMLRNIYSEAMEKQQLLDEEGSEFITYKPINYRLSLIKKVILFILILILCECIYLTEKDLFSTLNYLQYVPLILLSILSTSRTVLEIRWYKDKFVLRTYYGKKEFSFNKAELYKVKRSKHNGKKFMFKKNMLTFVVDERDYPEVAKKMAKIYHVE